MQLHRIRRPFVGLLVALVAVSGLVGASASGLSLDTASLTSFSNTGVTAGPPKVTCDNFTNNGNLSGRAVRNASSCGVYTWTAHTGSWTTNGGQARPSNTANATATVAAGSRDRTVQVVVSNAGGGSDVAGLALAHNGSSATPRYLAVALVGSSTVQLRLVNGTTVTTIASATTTVTSNTLLRASLRSGVVNIWVNGSLRMTRTLTAGQQTTISAGTRYGLYDNANSGRYDNFLLTQNWP